jgi:hypothetical protein
MTREKARALIVMSREGENLKASSENL